MADFPAMMLRSFLSATFLAIAVISCAPTETRVVRVIDTAGLPSHPWNGKPESLVLETWGSNPAREPDGHGGSILSYTGDPGPLSVQSTRDAGGLARPVPSGSPDTAPPSPFGSETVAVERKTTARFWVDDRGAVYRVWFAPSVYKEGKDAPGKVPDAER